MRRTLTDALIGKLATALGLVILVGLTGPLGCSDDPLDENSSPNTNEQDDGPDAGGDADADDQPPLDGGHPDDAQRPDPDSSQDWDWDVDFDINAVIPARGPLQGGTQVFVTGEGLTDGTQLMFGNQSVDAELSEGQLVAQTPPADASGPVTVRVISSGGEVEELANGFTYANPVDIDTIAADALPNTGGIEISLFGSGFVEPMGVSFSNVPARRIEVVDDTHARVVIPSMPVGWADVRVTVPDEYAVVSDGIYFFEPIDVDQITPAAGDVSGGESVTITAKGLTADTTVEIGGQEATVESVDVAAGQITITTPPADGPGPANVMIESTHDIRNLAGAFVYDDQAQNALYSIQPPTASVSGGSEHVVSGRDLDADDAEILVGDEAADIVAAGPAHALVEVPSAGASGTVDVILERGGVEVDRLDAALTYVEDVVVDELTPAAGSADGGQTISAYGQGLDEVDTISFAGLSADFSVIDDDELQITTPTSTPGTVDVVFHAGDQQITVVDGFEYIAELQVWSLRPSRGAIAGDTFVTAHGQGFSAGGAVTVGGIQASDVDYVDPWTLTFRTPPSESTGEHDVEIAVDDQSDQAPYPFVYFNPLSGFGGAHGPPVDGAINVSVITQEGTPIPGAFVMLSIHPDTPHQGMTDENGQITLSGPGVIGPQTVTATAAEWSTVTVRELNAENLTVLLNPIDPEDGDGEMGNVDPPPMSYFQGEVTITGKSADPDSGGRVFNMSKVRATRSGLTGWSMPPGSDATVGGEGSYWIRTGVGDLALVVLCGYFDADADEFTPKLMGVERGLTASNGAITDVDLECSIPLDESMAVKFTDPVWAPGGPTYNEARPFLDFGFEGVYPMPDSTTGMSDILHVGPLPAPEGELDDLGYALIAGSYSESGLPYTETTVRDIFDLDQIHATPPLVGVPELQMPGVGEVIDDQLRLGLKGVNPPDVHYIVTHNSMGLPVWTFIAPGDESIIPLPEFPSFDDLPEELRPEPYQPGSTYTVAYAPRVDGFDYNDFSYADFSSGRWSAYAIDLWTFFLAP